MINNKNMLHDGGSGMPYAERSFITCGMQYIKYLLYLTVLEWYVIFEHLFFRFVTGVLLHTEE